MANSQEIPRESMLAKAREHPRARKVDEGKDHMVTGMLIQVVSLSAWVSGSDADYYDNVSMEGEDAPNDDGNLGEKGLREQREDEEGSSEIVHQEYEGCDQ